MINLRDILRVQICQVHYVSTFFCFYSNNSSWLLYAGSFCLLQNFLVYFMRIQISFISCDFFLPVNNWGWSKREAQYLQIYKVYQHHSESKSLLTFRLFSRSSETDFTVLIGRIKYPLVHLFLPIKQKSR